MISIIICSKDKNFLDQLCSNIADTIGVPFEIISRDNLINPIGICEAYNEAAIKAKYQYICFIHEDILFHTKNWGVILTDNFKNTNARVIGLLGNVVKTNTPSSVYIYESVLNRQNQLQRYPNGDKILCYENPKNEKISEVCIVDGFFIATKKEFWQQTKFSEDYLKGFHAYDIDFSLKNFKLGKVVVVYNILAEHLSFGNFNVGWVDAQLMLTNKWKKYLPFTADNKIIDLQKGEISNSKEFLKILILNRMPKILILKHYLRLLTLKPFNGLNLFVLRKIILGNSLYGKLKKLLKTKV